MQLDFIQGYVYRRNDNEMRQDFKKYANPKTNKIEEEGMVKMGKTLGIDIYSDTFITFFFFCCQMKNLEEVTEDQYLKGLYAFRCNNLNEVKNYILNVREELLNISSTTFKNFYKFLFKVNCLKVKKIVPMEVVELYFSLGLSSVPSLLRTVNQLSNGEKARFELAWKLGNIKDNSIVYFDEFTSVVNRECAKSMSFALQRYVRKHNIKVVLASCHFDIIEWLQPDLIWNLNKQTNGECELEHFIFADDNTDYSSYKQINENEILSDKRKI